MVSLEILVVDDNEINQVLLDAMLRRDGHTVVLASNGSEAVSRVQERSFDVVLMDIDMPIMDGLDATIAIRHLTGMVNTVPILAVTANVGNDDVRRCHAVGMNGHIGKPIERTVLRTALIEAVSCHRMSNTQLWVGRLM